LISTPFNKPVFSNQEKQFIAGRTPFTSDQLKPSLVNQFCRLTLANKNFSERCTIDLNLQFKVNQKLIDLPGLVIVEIKSDGKPRLSPLAQALGQKRIKASGFSKYCMGRVLTDVHIKRNRFKETIRKIEKLIG